MRPPSSTPDSGSDPRYPQTLAPLLGLQFVALAWVVLNQFRFHLGLPIDQDSGLAHTGYLGAQLFLIASGYVTAQLYARESPAHEFRFSGFLWTRLIRVYPLHLAAIATLALLVLAASLSHAPSHHGVFTLRGLVSNLFMVQAWGVEPSVSWNFPSWLISAEWFAFILFPLTAFLSAQVWRGVIAAVVGPVIWFAIFFLGSFLKGVDFASMTAQIGALQTIPAFLFGIGLHRLSGENDLLPGVGGLVAALTAFCIVVAALLRLSDLVFFPLFGALVFGVAESGKDDRPALSGPVFGYLGRLSYALFLFYLPVDIVYFHTVAALFGHPSGPLAWLLWIGVFPVVLAVAALAHHAIQVPAERWLRRHEPFVSRATETA